MDKLKMQTPNMADENFKKLKELFPEAVTEVEVDGKIKRAIDKDVLQQLISNEVVEGPKERYQFTWPGKREAMLLAGKKTKKTLRPVKGENPIDDACFNTTENLYIEGDNLEVLKILETKYAGKIKMIYIDPPYNTGNDFIYKDKFDTSKQEYMEDNGERDDDGNRLVKNMESNGRFHSDWLSMMYPRLIKARNLLSDDGVIFISIDDGELGNIKKICDEIFGVDNFRNTILVRRRIKSLNSQFADNGLYSMNVGFEYVLVYSKNEKFLMNPLRMKKTNASTKGRWDVFWSNADRPTMRYDILGFTPTTGQWRNSKEKAYIAVENYKKFQAEFADKVTLEEYSSATGITEFIRRIPNGKGKNGGVQHWIAPSDSMLRTSNWTDIEVSQIGKEIDIPFDNPKSKLLLIELIKLVNMSMRDVILDFFSGSATTAHAVMQLNAEDGGNRKFIMVQLQEPCEEKSEAFKAGYKNICEIGKERIRRAGKKIKEENPNNTQNLDVGFRVLRLDSSNMKDVFYRPRDLKKDDLLSYASNIKEGRTELDLLFQAMPEIAGADYNAKIEEISISGKKVFKVNNNYIVACFEENINEEVIREIAKMKPIYAVFRDGSFSNDSLLSNLEQIFGFESPDTELKIL